MRSTPPALQIAAENVPPGDAARSESGELSRDGHLDVARSESGELSRDGHRQSRPTI